MNNARHLSRAHVFAALMTLSAAGTGCRKQPSVEGFVQDNRAAISAYVARVASVAGQLSTVPAQAAGLDPSVASLVSPQTTVVVDDQHFLELRTDVFPSYLSTSRWYSLSTPGPSTSVELQRLVNAARARPTNIPDRSPHAINAVREALASSANKRFVAVVHTDEVRSATVSSGFFTGGSWRGRIFVWDLVGNRWVGMIPVSDRDTHYETRGTGAGDLNGRLNQHIDAVVRFALTTRAPVDGRYGQAGQSFPPW